MSGEWVHGCRTRTGQVGHGGLGSARIRREAKPEACGNKAEAGEMGETKGRQPEATVIEAHPPRDPHINYRPTPEGKRKRRSTRSWEDWFKEKSLRTRQGKDLAKAG